MGVLETKRVIRQPKRRRMLRHMHMIRVCVSLFALVVLTTVLGIVVYVVGFAGYTNVDLGELTRAEVYGYDGHGTVSTSTVVVPGYEEFFETVSVEIIEPKESANGQLSNGDKVDIEYGYDKQLAKQLGLRVKASEEYVIVKDLPEATVISDEELFAGIDISCEGIAPMVSVELNNNSTDEVLKTVQFEIVNPKNNYDVDEEVVVKAVCDAEIFAKNAYELENGTLESTKSYKVTATERYVSDAEMLPTELLEQMRAAGAKLFGTNPGDANEYGLRIFSDAGQMYTTENKEYTFRFTGTSYISSYFVCATPENMEELKNHYNDVRIAYDTAITQSDGKVVAAEAVVIFRNIVQNEDGSISVDLDSGEIVSVSRSDAQIKGLVRCSDDENYTSVRLER